MPTAHARLWDRIKHKTTHRLQFDNERLYLVVETKGSLYADDLRDKEKAKINCGRAHFQALELLKDPAQYLVASSVGDVFNMA